LFERDVELVQASKIKAFGYSRDKRPDGLQVVIALVITPDGLPLAYEVMRGNTSDKTTQRQGTRHAPQETQSLLEAPRQTARAQSPHPRHATSGSMLAVGIDSEVAAGQII